MSWGTVLCVSEDYSRISVSTFIGPTKFYNRIAPNVSSPELPLKFPVPSDCPEYWKNFIGEYGPDFCVTYILERFGRLFMLIEWFVFGEMDKTESPDKFRCLPQIGLYPHEYVEFFWNSEKTKVIGTRIGGVYFDRRPSYDPSKFKIKALEPVKEAIKREKSCPLPKHFQDESRDDRFRQPDLEDLKSLVSTVRYDIRYSTTNNFMNEAIFSSGDRALMQRPAAEALIRAHKRLKTVGYGIIVYNAYQPWYLTKVFWTCTPDHLKDFIADPDNGAINNRGCAADVGLYFVSGEVVDMVCPFDEFSDRAFADYQGGTTLQRYNRYVLRTALEQEGFTAHGGKWWHFDFKEAHLYPVCNTETNLQ